MQPSVADLHEQLLDAGLNELDEEPAKELLQQEKGKSSHWSSAHWSSATMRSVGNILETAGDELEGGKLWQRVLPMPKPVFLALICGGLAGGLLGTQTFLVLTGFLCLVAPLVYRFAMRIVAEKMKEYVEREDRDMFGVDIHIRTLDLSICYGRLVIYDMLVENPEGYTSQYMLQAKKIVVDLDMLELMKTRGQHIIVEEMSFEDVHAIIEYDGMLFGSAFSVSNFERIREHMRNRKSQSEPAEEKDTGPEPAKDTAPKAAREWTFQKVAFIDVGANLASKLNAVRVVVADLRFKHFSNEMGSKNLADLLGYLLSSISKTIISNMLHL